MNKKFDMEIFLSGVLSGSKATKHRHIRQAQIIQAAIQDRWRRGNPWTWQAKHLRWYLINCLNENSAATKYYYHLTALLIWKRLGKNSVALGRPRAFRSD